MTDMYLPLAVLTRDPVPAANDVRAGWVAFALFILGILVVAGLCWSFVIQLRKVNAARDRGVFGSEPTRKRATPGSDEPSPGSDA